MREKWVPSTGAEYSEFIKALHEKQEALKSLEKSEPVKRQKLTVKERIQILRKTDSRCHICGGEIEDKWDADHILSHSKGGEHLVENYLPAHKTCNNYRWDYLSEEYQEIMKLGIMLRTEIEKNTTIGEKVADVFVSKESRRIKRRKI
jgi:5-methylcytosine-specific restriction endonuclease McrA